MTKDKVTPKRLDKDTDRRLAALDRSAHAPVKKSPKAPKRGEQGSVHRGVVFMVAGLVLAGWGWSHGSRTPDGRWLLAVLIVGAALALLVWAGRRYRAHDLRDAGDTARVEGRVQQHEGAEHHLDGA